MDRDSLFSLKLYRIEFYKDFAALRLKTTVLLTSRVRRMLRAMLSRALVEVNPAG